MRQGTNPRRGRSRGNAKRHPSSKNQNVESNGPDVKLRGTAQQVHEKYLSLARDASSAGDRIGAESYLQFADHYYRLANDQMSGQGNGNARQRNRTESDPFAASNPDDSGAEDAAVEDGGKEPAENSGSEETESEPVSA